MVGSNLGLQNLTEDATNIYSYLLHTMLKKSLSNTTTILIVCIYSVLVIMGVIGNGLVIFVTGYKMKTTVNSIWFLNLAIADVLLITFLVYNIVVVFKQLNILVYTCWAFVFLLNRFASVFFLTVISVDRCLCTWFVVWAQNKRTLVKARIISVFVWILSIGCSIPIGVVFCALKANENIISVFMYLSIYTFIMGFLIPFLIISSSYIAIAVRVKRLNRLKHFRPYRVIISVILAFFICLFPVKVYSLCLISAIKNNCSGNVVSNLIDAAPFLNGLLYLNSCLNPILYVFMCDEFKIKLKKSLLLVFEAAFTEEHLGLRSTSLPHNS